MNPKPSLPFLAGFVVMLGFGWVGFPLLLYKVAEQPLQFNHAVHTTGAGMSCQDCHAFREDGSFAGIPGVELCRNCHTETVGSTETERLLVEQYVKQDREIPWRTYSRQPDNAYFPHVSHVNKAKLECQTCHGDHGSSGQLRLYRINRVSGYGRDFKSRGAAAELIATTDGMKMDECIDCHRKQDRRNACIDCHK